MASFMRVSYKLVFHQIECIGAIKRILSTTATYISSFSFMDLYIPCYCDVCLKLSALCVGVKTLHNTTHMLRVRRPTAAAGPQVVHHCVKRRIIRATIDFYHLLKIEISFV